MKDKDHMIISIDDEEAFDKVCFASTTHMMKVLRILATKTAHLNQYKLNISYLCQTNSQHYTKCRKHENHFL
jgi:hypothetical protein